MDCNRAKVVRFEFNEASASANGKLPSLTTSSTNASGTAGSMETPKLPPNSEIQSGSEELVCDYDQNITILYRLLEARDWEAAVERCQTHPIEARTWVIRYQNTSEKVRWRLLPLHSAIIFSSPEFVVQALIEHYPDALSKTDDQGMSPLHLAFRHHHDDDTLLLLLLQTCPEGISAKDYRGRSPIKLAMKRNGRYSAKLMHLYAATYMEVTLKTQEAISSIQNDEAVVCANGNTNASASTVEDHPVDEVSEFERKNLEVDEIDQLEQMAQQEKEIQAIELVSFAGCATNASVSTLEHDEHDERERAASKDYPVDEVSKVEQEDDVDEIYQLEQMARIEKETQEFTAIVESRVEVGKHEAHEVSELENEELKPISNSAELEHEGNEQEKNIVNENALLEQASDLFIKLESEDHGPDEFCSVDNVNISDNDFVDAEQNHSLEPDITNAKYIVSKLQTEHAEEIAALKRSYDERMHAMAFQTMKSLEKLHKDSETAYREVKEQYYQDMQRIKNYFVEEEKKEADTSLQLQNEIDQLRSALEEEIERKYCNETMMREVKAVQRDQLQLQKLIKDQQEELNTVQDIRAVMLKTLMQQDAEDDTTRKMGDNKISIVAERIRSGLERLCPEVTLDETALAESHREGMYHDDDISTITTDKSTI